MIKKLAIILIIIFTIKLNGQIQVIPEGESAFIQATKIERSGDIEYAFWGGGGGGSGHAGGGGGGGGGFRSGLLPVAPGPYSVTVGAGGAGGPTNSGNGCLL